MNKHAYLIMAHNNWNILEKLLLLLDDKRNDIFLHIDARVTDFNENILSSIKYSKVTLIDRKPVYWADFSLVDVTCKLLKTAKSQHNYSYYHLLSGTDLPIKSKHYIYNFFESSGKEFIGIVPKEVYYSVRRVKFYHLFLHNRYYRNSMILKGFDRIFEYIQKFCGVNRLKANKDKIMDGWTWFSITDDFCEFVLKNEAKINKMFSHTIASDELFMQTLAYNSEFRNRLYDMTDLKNGSMRFIDWQRGKPYTWGAESKDYELLINSPYLFARKFDKNQFDIVEKIYNEVKLRNENDQ